MYVPTCKIHNFCVAGRNTLSNFQMSGRIKIVLYEVMFCGSMGVKKYVQTFLGPWSSYMQGAIMITASHMPFMNNGFKFFTADGGLEKADISDILQRAAAECARAGVKLGEPGSSVQGLSFRCQDFCSGRSMGLYSYHRVVLGGVMNERRVSQCRGRLVHASVWRGD